MKNLATILERHKKWLNGESDGERADLHGAGLIGAGLNGANLYEADLSGANLRGAYLRGVDFREANLCGADLRGANLCEANLCRADLNGADLRGANLCEANLCRADLNGADLRGVDLRGADLYGAYLRGANLNGADLRGAQNVPFIPLACPDSGEFVGWKKCGKYIVKLKILEDSKRSSATTAKCRCDKAKVLEIQKIDGTPSDVNSVHSDHDWGFIYTVGKIVSVPDFCEDRFRECAEGIHFFINRQEAVEYGK